MLDAVVAAAFENVGEADQIAVDIGVRVDQRIAHTGLRGEVDHALEALFREQRRHAVAIGEIELDEAEARLAFELRKTRVLEAHVVVVVDDVEADDLDTASKQALWDRKRTRLNSSHYCANRMHASARKK